MLKHFLLLFLTALSLWSCPFDEAQVEVTIIAHKKIYGAALENDFIKAAQEISNNKELYIYFENISQKTIYQGLLDACHMKNTAKIKTILDDTLKLEILELLEKVNENFYAYQSSRLLLIKAKKHLKALTQEKKAMQFMNNILKSIGNPGLMGVGERRADKELFEVNRNALLVYLQSSKQ